MVYDDRSVKPMSASLMRARAAALLVSGLYELVPTAMTSSLRISVELPGGSRPAGPPYPFTFAVSPAWCSGVSGARLLAARKLDIAWLNPSVIATMAYMGKGPFRRAVPLRALAVFPSWDRLVVAAAPHVGLSTMEELVRRRPALRVNVANNDCVNFAIRAVLRAHGLTLGSFVEWGGTVEAVERPSNPRRREGILAGTVDLIIDEGLDSWGQLAADRGWVFLSFSERALQRLERYGFQRASLGGGRLRGDFPPSAQVIDYSGWPIVTHADLPEGLAYHFAAVLERARGELPYDSEGMPSMTDLCRGSGEAPLQIPLHPGAERYYRERGYL